jgi:thiol:disulfide interchange protein DsbC
MTLRFFTAAASLILALGLTACQADDSDIRQAVQALAPGAKVTQISQTGVKGLREVTLDSDQGPMVVYADEKGQFLLVGDLLDVKSRRNLTRERMDKLTEVKWDSLPLQNAFKVVRGNGKRKLAVFSDPDCPYCKKAEVEFNKMDNLTIYVFLYPLAFHHDAARKAKLVWCSKDRSQTWLDLMLRGRVPEGSTNCDNPIDANLALGNRLRVDGTPAIIFANGKRVPGYIPAPRLEAMLDAAEKDSR